MTLEHQTYLQLSIVFSVKCSSFILPENTRKTKSSSVTVDSGLFSSTKFSFFSCFLQKLTRNHSGKRLINKNRKGLQVCGPQNMLVKSVTSEKRSILEENQTSQFPGENFVLLFTDQQDLIPCRCLFCFRTFKITFSFLQHSAAVLAYGMVSMTTNAEETASLKGEMRIF